MWSEQRRKVIALKFHQERPQLLHGQVGFLLGIILKRDKGNMRSKAQMENKEEIGYLRFKKGLRIKYMIFEGIWKMVKGKILSFM